MKIKRASEIVSSPVMADVTYYDVPVYIESVSAENRSAVVHPLNQPSSSQTVSLSSLTEHPLKTT